MADVWDGEGSWLGRCLNGERWFDGYSGRSERGSFGMLSLASECGSCATRFTSTL
jgi:hypothetical protein